MAVVRGTPCPADDPRVLRRDAAGLRAGLPATGGPHRRARRGNRPLPPGVAAQLRHTYHLDQPFIVQYLLYLKGIVTGTSARRTPGRPVSRRDGRRPSRSPSGWPSWPCCSRRVLGIGAGLIAGLRRGGIFDATLLLASLVVIAVPIFVIGFVVQIVFGVKLGWINPTVGPEATWGELVVPAMVLGSVSFAYVLRLTRDSVTENLSADWVRTATAKGLSRRRVVTTHVLRNSLIPVVTFLGADLGALMARRDHHRGHLQHPRRRPRPLPGDHPGRGCHRRLDRHGAGAHLHRRPACSSTCSTPSWTRGSVMSETALWADAGPLRRRPGGDASRRRPTRSTSRPRRAASGWRPGARCAGARCSSSRR